MTTEDTFRLKRFLDAQQGIYAQARAELAAGEKQSHWMWFIFPQITGLGSSTMAQRYAIGSLEEAKAYLAHPVLGPRLHECATLVNAVNGKPLIAILGTPDDLKFHSSVTLFAKADGTADSVFVQSLQKYFAGEPDHRTLAILADRF